MESGATIPKTQKVTKLKVTLPKEAESEATPAKVRKLEATIPTFAPGVGGGGAKHGKLGNRSTLTVADTRPKQYHRKRLTTISFIHT